MVKRIQAPPGGAQKRATPRGTPEATPAIDPSVGSAGLTPQQAITNIDHTPTMFFFRWLLNTRWQGGAQGAGGGNGSGDTGVSVNGVLVASITGTVSVNGIEV